MYLIIVGQVTKRDSWFLRGIWSRFDRLVVKDQVEYIIHTGPQLPIFIDATVHVVLDVVLVELEESGVERRPIDVGRLSVG